MLAYVNLWELITTLDCDRQRDLPNSDKCRAIREAAHKTTRPAFGTELSLEVHSDGTWTIRIFPHDAEDHREVSLSVSPDGRVSVTRNMAQDGIRDCRQVSF